MPRAVGGQQREVRAARSGTMMAIDRSAKGGFSGVGGQNSD